MARVYASVQLREFVYWTLTMLPTLLYIAAMVITSFFAVHGFTWTKLP